MSKRVLAANYHQVVKVAKRLGFYFCRSAKGSHEIWIGEEIKIVGKLPSQTMAPNL